jgi:RNA binding exosome subunit
VSENKSTFLSSEVSLVIHATENDDKLIRAIETTLEVRNGTWRESIAQGHFGNEVKTASMSIQGKEADSLMDKIAAMLSASDKVQLAESLLGHIDEKANLYLRMDKQKLCRGVVALGDYDPVRIRFKPVSRFMGSGPVAIYRRILTSSG